MHDLKFLLFSDFHYKKKMYPATVGDLKRLFERAREHGAEFVVHAGDFCNDYLGSPELTRAYLNNAEGLAVFGCYGNHELESRNNSMAVVTPLLSNRQQSIVYGTADGKIGDGSIAYYYTDINRYRFIFLDTDYSIDPAGEYEHNRTASWGCPKGNTSPDSLGDAQLEWLERVISDAVDKKLSCITVSHASFCRLWKSSPDAERVRGIFSAANAKRAGSVIMAINGHYHTCNTADIEGVTYFDCPAVLNGIWRADKFYPYAEADAKAPVYTFDYETYDADGNFLGVEKMSYSALSMGAQSLFYDKPAYALITLGEGEPKIDISEMNFAYGISECR